MKRIFTTVAIILLAACTPDNEIQKLGFIDLAPGDKYQGSYQGNDKTSSLPYAYFRKALPSKVTVPFAAEYWLNINKSDGVIGSVSFKSKIKGNAKCFEKREEVVLFLIKHGFEKSEPRGKFFNLIAEKGNLLALYRCGKRFVNYGTPEEVQLPAEMSLTITTETQHLEFEKAMKRIEH